ncbi:MAG: hypothetical protein IAI50_15340 [Candidatus Eremiobacteraeota bacterium]|nr:hypothetical protein [Candidatus Eremiobacteraeota bacterium]
MARTLAVLFGGIILCSAIGPSSAADIPYGILIDGRPVDSSHRSGLNRNGIVYINVVRAVKTFDGLLTFDKGGVVRVSIGGRTIVFTIGSKVARLDDGQLTLAGAPFKVGGDVYVPLVPMATLGRAKVTVDRQLHRASLQLEAGEGFPLPAPTSTEQTDVQPSPAEALSFATTATTDPDGLHARVDISNTTAKPYTVDFPTGAQIAFIVSQNGAEIWNSAAGERVAQPSMLTIAARGSKTVTGTWPAFPHGSVGRWTLHVRLLTPVPLDLAPVSIGATTPLPVSTN